MNIAICDRYDTDITRISEFLDANIKKHMLNHALLEVDTFTSTDELLASPKGYSNWLLYHIPVSEIFYIESIGRKCMIHTSRKTYETNMALNHIESTLNDNSFIRCYRSYLVNMNYIQDILDTEIQLTNDDCIPLTLRKRSQIVKLFNKFLISHSTSE